jgi:hypothetical protein
MPRTLTAAVRLAALALLLPGKAVAGPPEGASGKMVYDGVADGLRQYRSEKDQDRRYEWLERLAPTKDPRVAIVLYEAAKEDNRLDSLLAEFFVAGTPFQRGTRYYVTDWWEANEANLRRRAKQLPQ